MNTKILKTIVDVLFYLMVLIQSNELIDLKSKVKEQQKQITELRKTLDASAKYAESNKKAVDAAIMQKGAQLNLVITGVKTGNTYLFDLVQDSLKAEYIEFKSNK